MIHISLKKQSGAILIVSLIMLLLLTIIGVTATQVTGLEEKMASNSRDQNLSFQAAESALRGAEQEIEQLPLIFSEFGNSKSWLLDGHDTLPTLSNLDWDISDSTEFSSSITEIKTQPRYFIKHIPTPPDINNRGYGESGNAVISYFIVTAKGTGAQDNSQSFLRLHYAKRFIN